jgi:glycosyltransferase involved in cell wall biosynthesis
MHIVWIHRGMYPERIGGTYTYIYELGRRLAARGHRVDVIASTRGPDAVPFETLEGIRVHRYTFRRVNPIYSTHQHLGHSYDLFRRLSAEADVDILGIHDSQLGLRLARSSLGRSVCQVPTYHAPAFLEYRLDTEWKLRKERSPARRLLTRVTKPPMEYIQWHFEDGVLRSADSILVLSQYSRSHIEKHFPRVDLKRVRIIPSGVDTDRFVPAADKNAVRRELGLDLDRIHLLTVRKLAPRMGLENLIRAMSLLQARGSEGSERLQLTICGRGRLMPVLSKLAAELGISGCVELPGHVPDEDLPKYYQASDLFVLPTVDLEGFGISTVEALSANLPVVGTPAGATPEILGLLDGRLLSADTSAEAIADAVESWLDWRGEDEGTERYRGFCLSNYSWDTVTDRVESYYEEVAEAFRGGARG